MVEALPVVDLRLRRSGRGDRFERLDVTTERSRLVRVVQDELVEAEFYVGGYELVELVGGRDVGLVRHPEQHLPDALRVAVGVGARLGEGFDLSSHRVEDGLGRAFDGAGRSDRHPIAPVGHAEAESLRPPADDRRGRGRWTAPGVLGASLAA